MTTSTFTRTGLRPFRLPAGNALFLTSIVMVGIMVAVTGLAYVLRETNALVGDYGFPLAGGFAAGGVIKWVVWTLMA